MLVTCLFLVMSIQVLDKWQHRSVDCVSIVSMAETYRWLFIRETDKKRRYNSCVTKQRFNNASARGRT